jgi:hypothetical protein
MATKQSLDAQLRQYNEHLDRRLKDRWSMSLRTFKSIKAVTQLVGAAAGIYAMSLGAPPLATFALTAVIISGPEALEYLINQGE